MIHPLAEDFTNLKDSEIEERIHELSKKFYMSSNPQVQRQISLFLDLYQEELRARRARMWQQQYQNRDKDLDNLIKVR
jgi:hypothetical protein